jgi:hypothetical protein
MPRILNETQSRQYDRERQLSARLWRYNEEQSIRPKFRPRFHRDLEAKHMPPISHPGAVRVPVNGASHFLQEWLRRRRTEEIDLRQALSLIRAQQISIDGAFKVRAALCFPINSFTLASLSPSCA